MRVNNTFALKKYVLSNKLAQLFDKFNVARSSANEIHL